MMFQCILIPPTIQSTTVLYPLHGFFLKKNILIPNVAEQKYSDFGGGKKK